MSKRNKAVENQRLATEIVAKFNHALSWRMPYKTKWDRYYKMYRSVLDEPNYPWQANVWVPYSFSTIETLVPRLVANRPQIDVMPREQADIPYAEMQSNLIDWQWEEMGMDMIMPDIAKTMCIYGTAIGKVSWKRESVKRIKAVNVDDDSPELGTVEEEVEEYAYDNPIVENVDLVDFFWDPRGVDIESCRWVMHRIYRDVAHLEDLAKQKIYKNIDLVKNTSFVVEDDEKAERRATMGVSMPTELKDSDPSKNIVELLEYWQDDRIVTIANRTVVIRDEENPYKCGKPFVRFVDQAVPHEFLGIGEIEPIETLQYELNDRRNQRMDNVTLILNRMWKLKNGANVDENELVSDAGGVVHTDDMDGLEALTMPDVTSSSYNEETLIKGDIQQTTGVSDFTKGVGGQDALANDTATGISLIQEAANARFRLKVQNIEAGIRDIGKMIVSLNEQYIDEEKVIRVLGDRGMEWVTVKPEDMRGNLDVKVEAGSTLPSNEAINRKQTMEAYQLFAGDPLINQAELKRMVLKAVLPQADPDKLVIEQAPGVGSMLPGEEGITPTGPMDQEGMLASAMAQPQV